ncbi:hypothetical protein G6F62_014442 [Rhizopus arrhizus]|nr:hypothetical protein G6F66_014909 [Rhizopus arrhizus]KAG1311358.1 hypothetical protein G6F62_014442 [Rhizopus arrhizus]
MASSYLISTVSGSAWSAASSVLTACWMRSASRRICALVSTPSVRSSSSWGPAASIMASASSTRPLLARRAAWRMATE